MIYADFNFRPAGQGGFYTGCFRKRDRVISSTNFNFVYDCGAIFDKSYLQEQIKEYKPHLLNNKLNILFLSHLDNDHINGVVELLDGNIECERIYLPYLTPIDRLFLAIKHVISDNGGEDFEFFDYLGSPHQYLLDKNLNIKQIIYIAGNTEGDFENSEKEIKPITPDESGSEFTVIDNLEDFYSPSGFSEADDLINSNSTKIVLKKGNKTITINRFWEFYLFYQKNQNICNANFKNKILELFNIEIEDNQITQNQLKTILKDVNKLKVFKGWFNKPKGSINTSGLIVQHKPINYSRATLTKKSNSNQNLQHFFKRKECLLGERKYFTQNTDNKWGVSLLTGDIGLKQIENITYIQDHLEKVLIFQVPHHGSSTLWNAQSLQKLNYKGMTSAIINFGYGNSYGHPKPEVLANLFGDNFDIRFCTQFDSFNYIFRLLF